MSRRIKSTKERRSRERREETQTPPRRTFELYCANSLEPRAAQNDQARVAQRHRGGSVRERSGARELYERAHPAAPTRRSPTYRAGKVGKLRGDPHPTQRLRKGHPVLGAVKEPPAEEHVERSHGGRKTKTFRFKKFLGDFLGGPFAPAGRVLPRPKMASMRRGGSQAAPTMHESTLECRHHGCQDFFNYDPAHKNGEKNAKRSRKRHEKNQNLHEACARGCGYCQELAGQFATPSRKTRRTTVTDSPRSEMVRLEQELARDRRSGARLWGLAIFTSLFTKMMDLWSFII